MNGIGNVACGILLAAGLVSHGFAGEFDCVLEPRQVLEIRSPIEGLIERVNVDRGDLVRKGQVIAAIDSGVERAAAAVAKQRAEMLGAIHSGESRVEFSSGKAARAKELFRQNFVSAEARDQAATEHRLAEAELRDARDNRRLAELEYQRQMEIIKLKSIRSPINGVVVERILNTGELAEAGVGRKPIFKLAEIDVLYVEVLLPAAAYGKVKLGMEVEVVPEIPADARYRASVKVIDRTLDAASGTFGVRLELPNKQHLLPTGIHCRAVFAGVDGPPVAAGRSSTKGPPLKLQPAGGIGAR
jgi:RND family efflux transporter MFP subunit